MKLASLFKRQSQPEQRSQTGTTPLDPALFAKPVPTVINTTYHQYRKQQYGSARKDHRQEKE